MFIYTSKCNNKTWWNFSQPSNIISPHRLDASSPIASSGPADQQKSSQFIHPNFGIYEWSSSRSNQSGYWILKLHQTFNRCVSIKNPVFFLQKTGKVHMVACWTGPWEKTTWKTSPPSPQTQLRAVRASHHFVHAELGGLQRKNTSRSWKNQNRSFGSANQALLYCCKLLAAKKLETIDHAESWRL